MRTLTAVMAAITLSLTCCCHLSCCALTDPVLDNTDPDIPVLFIRTSGAPSSIVAALWSDGTVVRVVDDTAQDSEYIEGLASAEQIEQILDAIRERGLACQKDDALALDLPYYQMDLRLQQGRIVRVQTHIPDHPTLIGEVASLLLSLELTDVQPSLLIEPGSPIPDAWLE